eukprot:scaffold10831_cov99-Amphora_coffeaeformis.AAC.1
MIHLARRPCPDPGRIRAGFGPDSGRIRAGFGPDSSRIRAWLARQQPVRMTKKTGSRVLTHHHIPHHDGLRGCCKQVVCVIKNIADNKNISMIRHYSVCLWLGCAHLPDG